MNEEQLLEGEMKATIWVFEVGTLETLDQRKYGASQNALTLLVFRNRCVRQSTLEL
jgi:hypothetical protein